MDATEDVRGRRIALLCVSLASTSGCSGFFKYGGFLAGELPERGRLLRDDLRSGQARHHPAGGHLLLHLPDACATRSTSTGAALEPSRSFLDFALYVTFFPAAGGRPDRARHATSCPSVDAPRAATRRHVRWGLFLMTLGCSRRWCWPTPCWRRIAEPVFDWSRGPWPPLDAWLGVLAFCGPDLLRLRRLLDSPSGRPSASGSLMPTTSAAPTRPSASATSGGAGTSRCRPGCATTSTSPSAATASGAVRTDVNLMVTMLLGGLWHGASWTFVVWGGLHGALPGRRARCSSARWGDTGWSPRLTGRLAGRRSLLGTRDLLLHQHHLGLLPGAGFRHGQAAAAVDVRGHR